MIDDARFSVLTPVHDPPEDVLRRMLASVGTQTYGQWEHCLVDDGSTKPWVRELLDEAAAADTRVKVKYRAERGGIVEASNDALAMASYEFVALLDHDDMLDHGALEAMAQHVAAFPDVDYLYSDEDKIDRRDRRFHPYHKPDWSPDRLRCQMYSSHLSVYRRSLVEDLGGFRDGFDGAQDWDLALRVTEQARRIVHVRELLYHWRALSTSSAGRADAKPWAHDASHKAVSEHVARTGVQAEVEAVPGYPGHYWLRPALRRQPLVSVVIPTGGSTRTRDGKEVPLVVQCVRSILDRSMYENLELVVVVDDHVPDVIREQLTRLGGSRLRMVPYERPFNFSAKINLGVAHTEGEYLLLLNDDIEVPPAGWRPQPRDAPNPVPKWPLTGQAVRAWMESLVVYGEQPGVGAVGAKLYFPDGRLQHAGVVGVGGAAGHPYYGADGNMSGYWGNLIAACDYLAVTGACLLTPRSAFDEVGGFDEDLPINYNDVDYCLKLHAKGYRSVFVPEVELLHWESASRGRAPVKDTEIEELRRRWGHVLSDDPYYHPSFIDGDFRVRPDSRLRAYMARARQLYDEGGVVRVAERGFNKLRRQLSRVRPRSSS
jgi:GT2 family glycosyltransferase